MSLRTYTNGSFLSANIIGRIYIKISALSGPRDADEMFFFYHVQLYDGSWLAVGAEKFRESWRIVASREDDPLRLVLCVSKDRPQASFLLAPDGRMICLVGDHLRGQAISGRVVAGSEPNAIKLQHPLAGSFLGVRPAITGIRPPIITFDHDGEGKDPEQVILRLQSLNPKTFKPKLRRLVDNLKIPLNFGFSASVIFDLLRHNILVSSLAESILRVLPADELVLAGAQLVASASDRKLLRRCIRRDPWITRFLPDVIAWVQTGRPSASQLAAPAEQDALMRVNNIRWEPTIGFALHAFARRAISPRRQSAVFTKVRNDGVYILDWIAYHRSLGFDHIFIYSNDNDDGSDMLLGRLAVQGVITWIRSEIVAGTSPQDKANNHILNLVPQVLDYRWLLSIDSDEYLGLHERFDSIGAYIGWHENKPVDAIALCWLMYGARETDGWCDVSSIERFSLRERDINPHVKCLLRPNRFWGQHPHYPYAPLGEAFAFRTEAGRVHHGPDVTGRSEGFADPPSAQNAWINHYVFRSCLEMCWKMGRGRANWIDNTASNRAEYLDLAVSAFMSLSSPDRVVEDKRSQVRLAKQYREHARLLELPGVAATNVEIKSQFEKRLREVSYEFLDSSTSSKHARFRDIVRIALNNWR